MLIISAKVKDPFPSRSQRGLRLWGVWESMEWRELCRPCRGLFSGGNAVSPVELTFEGGCTVADGRAGGSPFQSSRRGFNLEKAVGTTDGTDGTDREGLGLDLPQISEVSRLARGYLHSSPVHPWNS